MNMQYQILIHIAKLIKSSLEVNPLDDVADSFIETAKDDLEKLPYDQHPYLCLNRALVNFTNAYNIANRRINRKWRFIPNTKNILLLWKIQKNLWEKRTKTNELCFYISIINYFLGNLQIAQDWLFKYSSNGDFLIKTNYSCVDVLKVLGVDCSYINEDFYRAILGDRYEGFHNNIILPSDKLRNKLREMEEDHEQRKRGAVEALDYTFD